MYGKFWLVVNRKQPKLPIPIQQSSRLRFFLEEEELCSATPANLTIVINSPDSTDTMSVLTKFFAILATVLFCLISPIVFLIVLLPLQILRIFVSISAKFFRPDLIQLVSKRSSVWTCDNLSRPESNITVVAIFDRAVKSADFSKEFETKVLLRKRSEDSKVLQYPRLQQYYEYWFNFSFWKKDTGFDLSHHLRAHTELVTGKDDLLELANSINRGSWDRKRSLWSGVLVEDYYGNNALPCSAWIFTIHHSLADAFSIQCLINSLLDGRMNLKPPFNDVTKEIDNPAKNSKPNPGILNTLVQSFQNIYVLMTDLLQVGSNTETYGGNIIKDRQIVYNSGSTIPQNEIEAVQLKFGVSMTAVQGAMACAALLKMFQRNEIVSTVPDFLHLMFPYSHPGHSRELSNYQAFVFLKLPVGITTDSVKRLMLVEQSVISQRQAGFSKIYSVVPILLGGLLGSLIKPLYRVDLPSGVMISLCIDEPIHFQGAKVTDIQFISGPLPGNQGIFFFFMKFMQDLDLGVGISESFTSKNPEVSQNLIKDMLDEFRKLVELSR